ncbi:2-keto-4-pentenoate hydratase [Geomicrobium sp. JSM 1781026]|uniref:2-keto-4-pentenoate hydratase n=1 Tax=Geomicrobium sp. JSM 1781026 TaxID=3344580 RepID=UPI0035BFC0E1
MHAQIAKDLHQAATSRVSIPPLTATHEGLTVEDAYQIQTEFLQLKDSKETRQTGRKIGLTSKPMQQLLGVNEPDYGVLFSDMLIQNDGVVETNQTMQPKVEAEIAFVLKRNLQGPNVTVADVFEATDYLVPSIEIVDSRIKDWKITLPDTIADNASSGLYVLGNKVTAPRDVDAKSVGMVLYKNGEIVGTGVGALAMGDPATCVAWLANKLSEYGEELKAGETILSGALSAAVEAAPGDHFTAKLAHLGEVNVRFAKS